MNALEKFANLDKKFAWSFLGFVLAVFFGGLTIYNEFIKAHDPQMIFEILSDTNVLDLKENVPELKILYGDVDIKNVGKDLSVMVFRIKNIGGASILGGFYDANSPVGITLSNGEFLKVEKIDASNEYLKNSASAIKSSPTSIKIPNVIMEPGESYTLKALIIHAARTATIIKSSGKIAGMRNIPVVRVDANKENETFWSKVSSGSIGVQAARSLLYFFAFIFSLSAVIFPLVAIFESFQKRSRKKSISQFKAYISDDLPDGHDAIFECYLNHGLNQLVRLREMLGNPEALKEILEKRSQPEISRNKEELVFIGDVDFIENHGKSHVIINGGIAGRVIKKAEIARIEQDGSVHVDLLKEKFLGRLVDYITIKES